jgi:predicted hotdog family 3-hydroxylacyl-ACP dehydratase
MLLIDEIVDVTGDRIECRTTIHRDCVFAIDGQVHASALIEFVAQACAIYVGVVCARKGDPPRMGLIMSCREVSFAVDRLAVGIELTIVATKIFGHDQLAAFTGTVSCRGESCASIQLSVVDAAHAAARAAGGDDA